jgi:hypothetical protein
MKILIKITPCSGEFLHKLILPQIIKKLPFLEHSFIATKIIRKTLLISAFCVFVLKFCVITKTTLNSVNVNKYDFIFYHLQFYK